MNIDELKLTYENASEEHKEEIRNVIMCKSRACVRVLKSRGIITEENAETLITYFGSVGKDEIGRCNQCTKFTSLYGCTCIEDLINSLESYRKVTMSEKDWCTLANISKRYKKETISKTDVIDDLNQVLKLVYKRIYAIEKRLDNLEEATWGQKTTFTITELQGK
jgi:hypothetical protein